MTNSINQITDAVADAKERLEKADDNLHLLRLVPDQMEALKEYVGASIQFEIARYAKSMVRQIQTQFSGSNT